MQKKKEYRSAVRSKRLIRDAFAELLQEKELRKITVTDIVKRADINRSTFYAHYPDVQGIVEEMEDEVISIILENIEEWNYKNIFNDPMPFVHEISRTLEENREFYKVLEKAKISERFMGKMKIVLIQCVKESAEIPESIRKSPFLNIHISFFIGGIISTYQEWFEGKLDYSLENFTMDIGRIIKESSTEILTAEWLKLMTEECKENK